jgi:hypothetical protein
MCAGGYSVRVAAPGLASQTETDVARTLPGVALALLGLARAAGAPHADEPVPAVPVLPAAAAVPAAAVDPERAEAVLFTADPPPSCAPPMAPAARVRCLVAARYRTEARSTQELALRLHDEMGDVPGSERELDMDGGFRGRIHILPALPTGEAETHLRWVLGAQRDIEAFVVALERRAGKPLAYRHRALVWRFFHTVKKRTPSAYASGWEVGYNLDGSLNRSAATVRDTIFHEVFHLNDFEHRTWSRRALGPLVDGILARCRGGVACLATYAPTATRVRKTGMYYAFQPDNGDTAVEYAAELATRYFLEQRAVLRGERLAGPAFKCGPDENARAWRALADEFFAGVDLVPACR